MLGLGLCVAMTLATLVWQSSIILWGVNQRERRSLIQQVQKIQEQGKSHLLWRWVCEEKL
jgi:succinate dehydrogenase/fumarate reductase-like Fe-S protein